MKLHRLVPVLMALGVLMAGTYVAQAAEPDSDSLVAPEATTATCPAGWTCNTSVTRAGDTTRCDASVTSPGAVYNIYMYGAGPSGKALHTSGGAYYGTASTASCYSNYCSVRFTYTGSARPTLCNWAFQYW